MPGDVVEEALAGALAAAAAAGRWDDVMTLAGDLRARVARAGAQPAKVIDLDDEKRRRGR